MEYLITHSWAFWIAAGIFFLVLELVTTALVSIWFVPAAAVTAIISVFVSNIGLQIIIFVVLSIIAMALFRKFYKKKIVKPVDDVKPESKLVGKSAKTVETTDKNGGRVKCGDIYWRAVTENGEEIAADENVIITGANDTTLVIKKTN